MSKVPLTSGPGPASLQVPGSQTPSPGFSPPSGAALGKGTVYPDWKDADPRSSSTQSLAPSEGDDVGEVGGRRTLLMVYIHGFMGNDTSFKSFPAHIHNYLKEALADSHVIHSKIYPRYKTYKAIDVARDNFSSWLVPHESPTTDVILLGHSMGGLLAADIVLIVSPFSSPFVRSPEADFLQSRTSRLARHSRTSTASWGLCL
jgi:pimeloyl-ACP methyl ester carboxylesterase